jgi:hypothetical protein
MFWESPTFQERRVLMKTKIVLALLLLLTLGCSSALIGDLMTKPGDVLFKDDFSQTTGGWSLAAADSENKLNDGSLIDYADGGLQIFVNSANYFYWSNPGLSFKDVRVEVDATLVNGPEINQMGIICRFKDDKNFYFFIISSDGYYAIGKIIDDKISLLGSDEMQRTRALNPGTNHLRADCIGQTLTFYANDKPLGIVEDAGLAMGDVGLMAGAFDDAGVDVRFDNFVAYKP